MTTPAENATNGTTNETTEVVGFGVRDEKGREIGAAVWRYTVGGSKPYGFTPGALRGGQPFGPIQRDQAFETLEAREAAVARYLKGARARALAKAQRGGAR